MQGYIAVKQSQGFKNFYSKLCSLGFERQKTYDGRDLMPHSFIKHVSRTNSVIKIPNIIPFLALKSFAYSDPENGSAKDAFDIWYTVVNYGIGPDSVNKELLSYKGNLDVKDAFSAVNSFLERSLLKAPKMLVIF